MSKLKGFFRYIFDFSFSEFITTKIIKFLYGISVCCSAIIPYYVIEESNYLLLIDPDYLIYVIPLASCACILVSRVFFEFLMVVFRIAENTGKIADRHMAE
jgi:hypothetical protein